MSGTGLSEFRCVPAVETRHQERGLFDLQWLFITAATCRKIEITVNIHLVINVCQLAQILEVKLQTFLYAIGDYD